MSFSVYINSILYKIKSKKQLQCNLMYSAARSYYALLFLWFLLKFSLEFRWTY